MNQTQLKLKMFKKNYKKYEDQSKESASPPKASVREGKLYQRLGRAGEIETNALDWGRSWLQVKLLSYPPELRQSLEDFVRVKYDIDKLVATLEYEPELLTSKDNWTPTGPQRQELSVLEGDDKLWREKEIYAEWSSNRMIINAEIRRRNDRKKAEQEVIIKNGGQTYQRVIGQLMGEILADMMPESRKQVEKWVRPVDDEVHIVGDEKREWIADNMKEAHEIGDWLFIFEAAQKTHLLRPMPKHDTGIQARRDALTDRLRSIKHESGSFERWIERFEDFYSICETAGCVIEDSKRRNFFMDGLNPKIFSSLLVDWKKTVGRPDFPEEYEQLKELVKGEYNAICMDPERARMVAEVMYTKSGAGSGKTEMSLEAKEEQEDDRRCYICEQPGHIMRRCEFYDKSKTKAEMREAAAAAGKIATKKKGKNTHKRADGDDEEKEEQPVEKVGKCVEVRCGCPNGAWSIEESEVIAKSANLKAEQSLVMGVKPTEVDFIYDTGTHHGVASEREMFLLQEVIEDPVLLEGVGGQTTLSKETGDSIFGKTRVLKGRRGSVLVSNYSTKDMYQILNPDPERIVLKGWESNPKTRGKEYVFERDEDRYGDPLLHCTMSVKSARCFAGVEKFYDPPRVPEVNDEEDKAIVAKVEIAHRKWNHATAQELQRINTCCDTGVTDSDIKTWKRLQGDFCSGCIEGSLKEQNRVRSTKPLQANEPGEVGVADLMFVEGRAEIKTPLYVHVDVYSKAIIGVPMRNKTEEACLEAFKAIKAAHLIAKQELRTVVFDRESAIMALEADIRASGTDLVPKAAGQKVGLAEVNIRSIRIKARSTKAGVRERYGYLPANQFNVDLCMDGIGVLNRIPKEGREKTPIELFSGKEPDLVRDLRAEWGETIIVKKPRGIASNLNVVGEWAVVVRRIMNGTGVLKVYLVQSKRYAYRIKFKRAKAPEWVIGALNSISKDQRIGFEETTDNPEGITDEGSPGVAVSEPLGLLGEDSAEEVVQEERIGELTDEEVQEALDTIDAIDANEATAEEREGNDTGPPRVEYDERPAGGLVTRSRVENRDQLELERNAEWYAERVAMGLLEPEPEDRDRVIFNRRHRRTEANVMKAQEVLRKAYLERYGGLGGDEAAHSTAAGEGLETEFSGVLFQQAMRTRPEAAEAALEKEVRKAVDKRVWHPVHEHGLTPEEKKLILPMMKNYVEKFSPDNVFEKSKVRVLVRGDLQTVVGEQEGPVCRFESLSIVLSIAAYKDLEVFKIDVTAAYMNTPMPEDVKHRWVRLDRDVVRMLRKIQPGYWDEFVQPDGTALVEMDKLIYGFKEAAKYWNVILIDVFLRHWYKRCEKDKCVMFKESDGKIAICGITVDDCFFAATRDEEWIQAQIKMLSDAFSEITVERGDELGIVGIQVQMDRTNRRAILSQRKFAAKVVEVFGVSRGAPNPALTDAMADDDDSPLLADQREFMSKNALLMFGATRTYPEIRPIVARLATKYNKATELDMKKAIRVAEYIFGCMDDHVLVLAPKSLQLVATSDASYAENPDGTSNDGGCVGFESDEACWVAIITGKQAWPVLSACEAELVASCRVGTFVEWAKQLVEELGYVQGTIKVYHDSTCAMSMLTQGTGSFKRAKHIKVRYFWVRNLVDEGVVKLVYCPSKELVADMLTKPIVGAHYWYLLRKLLGWSRVMKS